MSFEEFETREDAIEYCKKNGRSCVSFSLAQNGEELGTFYLELYNTECPKTCAHFLSLVKGNGQYCYKNTPIHRVVPSGFIQGGDVVDGTGKGKANITLVDETFAVKHDKPGMLGMANLDQPHTASTQFYITLSPLPWLDGKRVAFGRVLTTSSFAAVKSLEDVALFKNERPVPDVMIADCAVLYEASS